MNVMIDLTPSQDNLGEYQAEWTAEKPGTYLAEVTAESTDNPPQTLGSDVLTFQREEGSRRISTLRRTAACSSSSPLRPAAAIGSRRI